ncbi:MAG: DUF4440 domain-containing protein [Bacteroidia bacterium]|nr:DUF4440 domain-containing protein [Bacteroidia bacterium]
MKTLLIGLAFILGLESQAQSYSNDFSGVNQKWIQHVNTGSSSIKDLYTTDALKVFSDGTTLNTTDDIANHLFTTLKGAHSIKTKKRLTAHEKRQIDYEVSQFRVKNNENYKQLIIWEKVDGRDVRAFEFIEKSGEFTAPVKELNQRREEWMKYCNAHDVSALVNDLYTSNTIYFNHKPAVIGTEKLIKEYSYMENPAYSLKLEPIIIEAVNKELVFEIGQCQGSYNGKYVLIWQKDSDGKWKVLVDSNI